MTMKEIRMMLNAIPDDAAVTINDNYNVDIVSVSAETTPFGIKADLKITSGYSITMDSVLDGMMETLKHAYETR